MLKPHILRRHIPEHPNQAANSLFSLLKRPNSLRAQVVRRPAVLAICGVALILVATSAETRDRVSTEVPFGRGDLSVDPLGGSLGAQE